MKILGLVFFNNLIFYAHFSHFQWKCIKRWEVRSLELLRLVNGLTHGLLVYAALIYSTACRTSFQRLDVIYTSTLCLATGLPKLTPIFTLYRESDQTPLAIRSSFLTEAFYVWCIRFSNQDVCVVNYLPKGLAWHTIYKIIILSMLIPSCCPSGWILDKVTIHIDDFPFQCPSLPLPAVQTAFPDCVENTFADWQIIATDISKTQ